GSIGGCGPSSSSTCTTRSTGGIRTCSSRVSRPRAFGSIEEIVNYLLGHKEVADLVSAHGPGKAAFLMFDDETEQLAGELDLEVAFPAASLRHRLDSKIETTRLGNDAGVPSVPHTMGTATTYAELVSLA